MDATNDKDDILSTSNENNNRKASSLSEAVQQILVDGMREGFEDGCIDLHHRDIDDSMIPELCEWIVKLGDKVKGLSIGANSITSAGVISIVDTLKSIHSRITGMWFDYCDKVGDGCMKDLGEFIKMSKCVETLSLRQTQISDEGIELLAPYLDGNATLKNLFIENNPKITDKSEPVLVKMIESSYIEDLSIFGTTNVNHSTFILPLASNIIKHGSSKLYLPLFEVDDNNIIKICDVMKANGITKLKDIYFNQIAITSKGASVLFETLRECNSMVSKIELSSTEIDDNCMKQLGEFIQFSEHLEIINLEGNKITDKGIEILSDYLIGNMVLKKLQLNDNDDITDASTPFFVEVAKKSHVTSINLQFTSVSHKKIKEIKAVFNVPVEKREIPIKSSTKSAAKISSSE